VLQCIGLDEQLLDGADAELGAGFDLANRQSGGQPVWCRKSNEPYDIVIEQYYG
jgi:hypothetical protein